MCEGYTFIGYSTVVKSIRDVNEAYIRVRELAQGACHIMCAFRLPGKDFHRMQSYNDDDEHGGGNIILRLLETSDIMNCAVFVAWHYEGVHIGNRRYDLILDTAKAVIEKSSFNEVTHQHQFP